MNHYTATIIRDACGVPHVFGYSEADALYGFGYAQAEDRLPTLLAHYLGARGEAASVLGAPALERDIAARAFRVPEFGRERYGTLPGEVRAGVEAFADGVNRYQADHAGKRPAWAFDVTPQDVVALALLYNLYFATDPFERDPSRGGSNAFAVAPARTVDGVTLVSLDPHLPLDGPLRWYEGRVCGGAMNVYGVTFAGLPYIAMGTNGLVAWANTVNAPDLSDLYEIRLRAAADGTPGYEYDGAVRPCALREYQFAVRRASGAVRTMTQQILSTHHGPVLREANGVRYALRKAGVGDVDMLTQSRTQSLATNADEYRAALAGCHVVMFNHVFGDQQGGIGYVSAGQVPRRPAGYDFNAPVPGWTNGAEWGDAMPIDELPQAMRPASGFVQNCNDAPGCCGALDMQVPPPYPHWLAPDIRTLRGARLRALLEATPALSAENVMAIATDCADLNAARELPALLAAATVPPECAAVLTQWGGTLRADARGAALFQAWLLQPFVQAHVGVGGYVTPDALAAAPLATQFPNECAAALADAAEWLRAYGFALDVPWGDLHRLQRGTANLPCDGGLDSLCPNGGRRDDATGITTVSFGSSYRALVELREGSDPRIWACLPWGNSDDPASPFFADQLPVAARRGYRRVPWARSAVEGEASGTVRL